MQTIKGLKGQFAIGKNELCSITRANTLEWQILVLGQ